jgi:hypothetical protein
VSVCVCVVSVCVCVLWVWCVCVCVLCVWSGDVCVSDDEAEDIMLPASPPKETSDSPAKKPRKKRAKKPCPQGHEPCDCPPKAKRKPTAYALFVKEHYNSVRDKPCCDRFKLLAQKWKEHKAKGSTK